MSRINRIRRLGRLFREMTEFSGQKGAEHVFEGTNLCVTRA